MPLIVNYESLAIDGYVISFSGDEPKFEQFIMDIQVNEVAHLTDDYAGISFKGLWFNK